MRPTPGQVKGEFYVHRASRSLSLKSAETNAGRRIPGLVIDLDPEIWADLGAGQTYVVTISEPAYSPPLWHVDATPAEDAK